MMGGMKRRIGTVMIIALCGLWGLAGTALGEAAAGDKAAVADKAPAVSPWVSQVVAVVLVLGLVAVSFIMSSRRTHQD
jgi:hypothetical protein